MNIRSRREGDRAVVEVSGHVDMESVERFRRILMRQVEGNASFLVLEASGIRRIFSGGLAVLIEVLSRLRRQGRSFWILNPSQQMRHVLALTRLESRIPVVDAEECSDSAKTAGWSGRKGYRRYVAHD